MKFIRAYGMEMWERLYTPLDIYKIHLEDEYKPLNPEDEDYLLSPREREEKYTEIKTAIVIKQKLLERKRKYNLPHKLRMDINNDEVVWLRDHDKKTFKEIGEFFGCSPQTALNRYNRAKGIK